jgi:hypothetical protein
MSVADTTMNCLLGLGLITFMMVALWRVRRRNGVSFWRFGWTTGEERMAMFKAALLFIAIAVLLVLALALSPGQNPNAGSEQAFTTEQTPRPPVSASPRPTASGALGSPTPRAARCLEPQDVSLANVGQSVCVQGTVLSAYRDAKQNVFFITFSKDVGRFYMLTYGGYYPTVKPGLCVRAEGKVERLGPSPVIVLRPSDPVLTCTP